jgi:type III secretion protein J
MSRWRRILCVIFISLLAAACQTELYRGLTQRDANEMTAILARNGVNVVREQTDATTYRLMVPNEQFNRSVDILKRLGYPRETFQSLGDVFKGEGLIISPFEQRIRMMHALNQEMVRTISAIDGVVQARVHVVVPELDLRGMPMTKPTASVVVHHRSGVDTGELSAKIRLIVANGVQGLAYKDVSLAFFESALTASRLPANPFSVSFGTGQESGGSTGIPATPVDVGQPNNTRGTNNSASGLADDPYTTENKERSMLNSARTWTAMVLWGLAVMMALVGVVFVILNSIGVNPSLSRKKTPVDTKTA